MGNILGTCCMAVCCEPCCPCCMNKDVPWRLDQLNTRTLSVLLRSTKVIGHDTVVTSVSSVPIGVGEGFLSNMAKLTLKYDPDSDIYPRTMIAKVTPEQLKPRILGALLGFFQSEVDYYKNEMAEKTGMAAPTAYYAGGNSYGRYLLLMEDLSPGKPIDQLKGCSVDQARLVLDRAAAFHANYYNLVHTHPDTKLWTVKSEDHLYGTMLKVCEDAYAVIDDAWYQKFGLEKDKLPHWHEHVTYMQDQSDGRPVLKLLKAFYENFRSKNENGLIVSTLIHGDLRLGNIFFNAPASDRPGSQAGVENAKGELGIAAARAFTVVDYQLVGESSPLLDIAYFLSGNVPTDERRTSEKELLMFYYDEMKQNLQKKASKFESEWTKFSFLFNYLMCTLVLGIYLAVSSKDITMNDGAIALIKSNAVRTDAFFGDWDCMEFFKAYLKKANDGLATDYSVDDFLQTLPKQYHDFLLDKPVLEEKKEDKEEEDEEDTQETLAV